MAYELDLRVSASTGDAVNNLERVQDSVRNVSSATTQAGNTISQSMNQATTATQNYGKAVQDVGKVAQNVNTQGIVQGINAITSAIKGDGGAESIITGFSGALGGLISTMNPVAGMITTAVGNFIGAAIGKITDSTEEAEEKSTSEKIEELKTKLYEFSGTANDILEKGSLSGLSGEFTTLWGQLSELTDIPYSTVFEGVEGINTQLQTWCNYLNGKDANGDPLPAMTDEEIAKYTKPFEDMRDTLNSLGINVFAWNDEKKEWQIVADAETIATLAIAELGTLKQFSAEIGVHLKKTSDETWEFVGEIDDIVEWCDSNPGFLSAVEEYFGITVKMYDTDGNVIGVDTDALASILNRIINGDEAITVPEIGVPVKIKEENGVYTFYSDLEALETWLKTDTNALSVLQKIEDETGIKMLIKDESGNVIGVDNTTLLTGVNTYLTNHKDDIQKVVIPCGFSKTADGTKYEYEGDYDTLVTWCETHSAELNLLFKASGIDTIFDDEGKVKVGNTDVATALGNLQAAFEGFDVSGFAEMFGMEEADFQSFISKIAEVNTELVWMKLRLKDITNTETELKVVASFETAEQLAQKSAEALDIIKSKFSAPALTTSSLTEVMGNALFSKFFRGEIDFNTLVAGLVVIYQEMDKANQMAIEISETTSEISKNAKKKAEAMAFKPKVSEEMYSEDYWTNPYTAYTPEAIAWNQARLAEFQEQYGDYGMGYYLSWFNNGGAEGVIPDFVKNYDANALPDYADYERGMLAAGKTPLSYEEYKKLETYDGDAELAKITSQYENYSVQDVISGLSDTLAAMGIDMTTEGLLDMLKTMGFNFTDAEGNPITISTEKVSVDSPDEVEVDTPTNQTTPEFTTSTELNGGSGGSPDVYNGDVDASTNNGNIYNIAGDYINNYYEPSYSTEQD